jgi:DNA-binding Xre family transcriptional regulator
MKLKELIINKYGSVNNMLDDPNISISKSYLYQIINGDKTNITVDVARELAQALEVKLDDLVEVLKDDIKEI